jgi:hypothetical protein
VVNRAVRGFEISIHSPLGAALESAIHKLRVRPLKTQHLVPKDENKSRYTLFYTPYAQLIPSFSHIKRLQFPFDK